MPMFGRIWTCLVYLTDFFGEYINYPKNVTYIFQVGKSDHLKNAIYIFEVYLYKFDL